MKTTEMKTMSISEFQNPERVSEMCKESDVPFLVKSDDGNDMVIMSIDLIKDTYFEHEIAVLINEAVEDEESGVPFVDGDEFFAEMRNKYGNLENHSVK
ncbi:MAG: hypothetical protein LUE20_10680 [Oscillospiraceae bacterium]|nr:hypothetical protein [Oscillospiraceae bacterium]